MDKLIIISIIISTTMYEISKNLLQSNLAGFLNFCCTKEMGEPNSCLAASSCNINEHFPANVSQTRGSLTNARRIDYFVLGQTFSIRRSQVKLFQRGVNQRAIGIRRIQARRMRAVCACIFHKACAGRGSRCAARFAANARTDRCVTRLSGYRLAAAHSPRGGEIMQRFRVGFYRPYGGGTFISAIVIGASLRPVAPLSFARVFIYYVPPLLPTSRAQVLGSLYETRTTTCLSWPASLPDRELEKGTTIPPRGFKGGSFWKSWESVVLRARARGDTGYVLRRTCPENFRATLKFKMPHRHQNLRPGGLYRSGLGGITDGSPVEIY